ncbi:iron chelate uptake ABC transporter family permease subunit [Paracoccus aminophilus]|uniref:High-affinity zinc uptake system membrane protein ZnuB n=1 Tax=Paracoccus aminophilus JCM 7686 TaxID=1367847 RepID=S5XRH3_PARAH|nr:iron chelate uptake ABC transporter family permease subunit [Paracoccus aminophilus]AGT07677.1 zinc transport system permease protein, ZnuB [Paracoccus aminophilus JCM 7686]
MLDDFLTRAAVAGLGLVLATGPLGSFVVWRRMAYFGDSLSHAAILGVALSFVSPLPLYLGTMIVAVGMAVLVTWLAGRGQAMDSALGVIAHSALALGLVVVSFVPSLRVDLQAFLFGDILAVGKSDLIWIWSGALAVLVVLIWRWQRLVTVSVNEELAMAAGIRPAVEKLILALALALVVAIAIRIVGALLISAMLIVPAAAARGFARTPEQMALIATLIGGFAIIGGLGASLRLDTPAGPSIIVAAGAIYALSLVGWRKRG